MKSRDFKNYQQNVEKKQRFGYRKLATGLATVLLGTSFYLSNGQLVHADENTNHQTEQQVEQNRQSTNLQTESKNETDTPTAASANSNVAQSAQSHAHDQASHQDTNVVVKQTDQNGQETSTIQPSDTKQMMAGQDNVNVHIDLTNLNNNDRQITFNFSNTGDKDDQKTMFFNAGNYKEGDTLQLDNNWSLTNQGNGTLVANWKNASLDPDSLSLVIPLQGNPNVVKTSNINTDVVLTITKNNQSSQYNILKAEVTPYEDKVRSDEIIKGFAMLQTTVAKEKEYGNISQVDLDRLNAKDNQVILQWGYYFNYGKGNQITNPDLNPLMDTIMKITYNGNQTLIPSSIRVFQVPDGMIVHPDGKRYGIDDLAPDGTTYYYKITQNGNERPDFENYLRSSAKGNTIAINQISNNGQHVTFFVPVNNGKDKDESYSKHAYFFQIDTLLPKDQTKPSSRDSMSYGNSDAHGDTIIYTTGFTGQITGKGNGVQPTQPTSPSNPTNPSSPTQPSNQSNPDNPTSPVEPTSPTSPEQPTTPLQPTEPEQPTVPDSHQTTMPNNNSQNTVVPHSGAKVTKEHSKTKHKDLKMKYLTSGKDISIRNSFNNNQERVINNKDQGIAPVKGQSQLPETGEKSSHGLGFIGLSLLVLSSLLSLGYKKKKN